MDYYFKLYWLTRLDMLCALFVLITFLSLCGFAIYNIFKYVRASDNDWDKDEIKEFKTRHGWIAKVSLPLLIIGSIGTVFIPTKDEAIFIIASGKTLDFVQKDTSVSKLPGQTTAYISKYLDEKLKELDKTTK